MKYFYPIFALLAGLVLFTAQSYGQFLINEDFEGTFPPTDALAGDWTKGHSSGTKDWFVQNNPAPNSGSVGFYAYYNDIICDTHNENNILWIKTPEFDCSGRTNVTLRFFHFWAGNDKATATVEVTKDGGTTWVQVVQYLKYTSGACGGNHENCGLVATGGDADDMVEQTFDISATAAGEAKVQVRFVYDDGNVTPAGWYIDDVKIYSEPDVGVRRLVAPARLDCATDNFGAAENITVRVFNFSDDAVTNVPVVCKITNGAGTVTTLNGTIANIPAYDPANYPYNSYVDYTFATTHDMSAEDIYNFEIYTNLAGDTYSGNNTFFTGRRSKVKTYPYTANFNVGTDAWLSGGLNPMNDADLFYRDNNGRRFDYGTLPYLNGDEGNGNSWHVQTYINAKTDMIWVESPVFDFTNNTKPVLSMDIKYQLRYDNSYFHVEYTKNGGTNWYQVGHASNPNWYNTYLDDNRWRYAYDGQTSYDPTIDSWTHVERELCFLSGEPCIQFRIYGRAYYGPTGTNDQSYFAFDNFVISAGEQDDVQPVAVSAPTSRTCNTFTNAEPLQIIINNNTCRPIYNLPVSVEIDGGGVINETAPGPIPRFGSYLYDFTATADLSASGDHTINVTTNLTTDSDNTNDTYSETRKNDKIVISGLPSSTYFTDFNSGNDGWVSRPESNPPTNTDYEQRHFRLAELPYLNGAEEEGNSWYVVETMYDAKLDRFYVESPVFDLTSISNPIMYFDVKYQLKGDSYFHVEVSTNGGSSWSQLGHSTDPNWYNTYVDNNWWRYAYDGQDSYDPTVASWTNVQHNLCDYIGEPCIKFRIYGRAYHGQQNPTNELEPGTDKSPESYFAFDNFKLADARDVEVTTYIQPAASASSCLYSSTQKVEVKVYNHGCGAVTNVPVECVITLPAGHPDASPVTLTGTTGNIPGESSIDFTLNGNFDMTPLGTYQFDTETNMDEDYNTTNDNSNLIININFPKITSYPYLEDFNSGDGFWTATGNNGRNFIHGTLPEYYLNGDEGEGDSWYIETTSNAKTDMIWVESPVFDFTNNTKPVLSMDIKYQLRYSDSYVRVEYSLNGGTNWYQLGHASNPNWYNNVDDNWWKYAYDGLSSYDPTIDSWTHVERELCYLSGEPCVKFRLYGRAYYGPSTTNDQSMFAFDNFAISAGEQDDIQPVAVSAPTSRTCNTFTNAEPLQIIINNNTCRPVTNIPVSVQIDGGAIINETAPGPIPRFGSYLYDFTATADLSASGDHTIDVTTNLTTDSDNTNDTYSETRKNDKILISGLTSSTYFTDFNSGNDGWVSRPESNPPTNTDYEQRHFRLAELPYLNGAEEEGNSWYVETMYDAKSDRFYVESPTFDLTGMVDPIMYFDVKYQLEGASYFHVEVSTDGGSNWSQLGHSTDPNWYNTYIEDNWWKFAYDGNTSYDPTVDSWTNVQHNLCDYIEEPCIKFRIYGSAYHGQKEHTNELEPGTDKSPESYFAFDNFKLADARDVEVYAYIKPATSASACLYSSSQKVEVKVYNHGCGAVTNVPVECVITLPAGHPDFPSVTLTGTTGNIPGESSIDFELGGSFNMTPAGTYSFDTETNMTEDYNTANDNDLLSIDVNFPKIATYPYDEDFNSDDGWWRATGDNPPTNNGRNFIHGTLPAYYLNGDDGEGDSWYVETTSNAKYDRIWVESPVFDFTTLTKPFLFFDLKYQLRYSDSYFRVDVSTDGGSSWSQLGHSTDPNWYNTYNWWRYAYDGQTSYDPTINTWTRMQHNVCDYAGLPCVKFRFYGRAYYGPSVSNDQSMFAFDNFRIQDNYTDVAMQNFLSPMQADEKCTYNPETGKVEVTIYNVDCADIFDVPLKCDITGALTQTLIGNVDIPAKSAVTYIFPDEIDMSAVGTYNFDAYHEFVEDQRTDNDHIYKSIDVYYPKITTYPYSEDFNSGAAYWRENGSNPPENNGRKFILGELPYLNGPDDEGDSWYVKTTSYAKDDKIWVESPVFDFTGLTNPKLSMIIKYKLRYSDSYMHVEYSTNGGNNWTQLGTSSDFYWYKGDVNWWRHNYDLPVDEWEYVEHELCNLIGKSCVKFRIYGKAYYGILGTSDFRDQSYFAFDNFSITDAPIDAQLVNMVGCYGTNYDIDVAVKNNNNTCFNFKTTEDNLCDKREARADIFFDKNTLPSYAFDGDSNTGWRDNGLESTWLEYDFGQGVTKTLTKYNILISSTDNTGLQADERYNPRDWTFEASNNRVNWIELDQIYGEDLTRDVAKDFSFTNVTPYRYYRIRITDTEYQSTNNRVHISELKLYEGATLMTTDFSASAGNNKNRNNVAFKAFDGKAEGANQGWGDDSALPHYLEYDFGATQVVAGYAIYCSSSQWSGSENYNPKTWTFEAWDGTSWVVLETVTDALITVNKWKKFAFTNSTAYSKYRLNITANESGKNTRITELRLYEGSTIPVPDDITQITLDYDIDGVTGSTTYNAPADFTAITPGNTEWITIPNVLVPNGLMLGTNLATGGTATASGSHSGGNNDPSKAFDGDYINEGWANDNVMPAWLQYEFPAATIIDAYRFICSSSQLGSWNSEYYNPKTWKFEGSNNGSTWTSLDEQQGDNITQNQWATYSFQNTTPYKYYRIFIDFVEKYTKTRITELELYNADVSSTVKIWSSLPNGQADEVVFNDKLYLRDVSTWPTCNDHCSEAIKIENVVTQASSNNNATPDVAEDPPFCSANKDNTVWYTFTTNCTGGEVTVTFQNIESEDGIQVSVEKVVGDPCTPGDNVNIFCQKDPITNMNDPFIWTGNLDPEETYMITIDGFGNITTDFELVLEGNVAFDPVNAMTGNYTINPNGDEFTNRIFTSFQSAMDSLRSFGVQGPVNISALAETYTEQIDLGIICGSSAVNTVTFTDECETCEDVKITYDAQTTCHPRHDKVLSFNGTDSYVQLPQIQALNTDFTIEFWVKNAGGNATTDRIIGLDNNEMDIGINAANQLAFYFPEASVGWRTHANLLLSTGVWHHVALIYEGTNIKVYIDGDEQYALATPTTVNVLSEKWQLGRDYNSYSYGAFELDELRIWRKTLSVVEIRKNICNTISGNEPSLVGYYKFESESYEITDETIYKNHGTTQNMTVGTGWVSQTLEDANNVSQSCEARGDKAIDFDDINDYVIVPNDISLDVDNGSFTVEAWIYPVSNGGYQTIIGDRGSGSWGYYEGYNLQIYSDKTTWRIDESGIDDDVSNSAKYCDNCGRQYPLNKWYHVAMVYDTVVNQLRFYVDGSVDGSVNVPDTYQSIDNNLPLGIGAEISSNGIAGTTTDYFNGKIDEVRIWKYARTPIQLQQNICTPLTGAEPNLIAYYPMNNDAGTTMTDESANTNDGTLTNSAYFVPADPYDNSNSSTTCIAGGNTALKFDGNDDYVVLSPDIPALGNTFTVECWVKHDGTDGAHDRIIGTEGDEFIFAKDASGNLRFYTPETYWEVGDYHLEYDTWTHIAVSYDGTEIICYANGTPIFRQTIATIDIISKTWYLGMRYMPGAEYGNMTLDEVRIWDDARTIEEINDNMCASLTGTETDLVSYYDMEGGVGTNTTLTDKATATQYTGTLTNMFPVAGSSDYKDGDIFSNNAPINPAYIPDANYTLKLTQTNWVTFDGITFEATSPDIARALVLDHAENDIFTNCKFTGLENADNSDTKALVYSVNDTDVDSLQFINNEFKGGSIGLIYEDTDGGDESENTIITGNTFTNQSTGAIKLVNHVSPTINSNEIITNSTRDDFIGINIKDITGIGGGTPSAMSLQANILQADDADGTGILIDNSTATASDGADIVNNMISIGEDNQSFGLQMLNGSSYQNILFNTINVSSTDATSEVLKIDNISETNIKNNIFSNYNSGNNADGYQVYLSNLGANVIFDYNNLYSNSGTNIKAFEMGDKTNLSTWQTGSGGANSKNIDPDYNNIRNIPDLHIKAAALKTGTPIAGVLTDFDGETRDAVTPYIGADEYLGLVSWTGATDNDWNNTGNWSSGQVPTKGTYVEITNTPAKPEFPEVNNATSKLAECYDLSIAANSHLYIEPDKYLTVWGDFTQNGEFVLKSGDIAGKVRNASFIQKKNDAINGKAELLIKADNWHYLGTPITTAPGLGSNYFSWDETVKDRWFQNDFVDWATGKTKNYIMGWTAAGVMSPGTGYAYLPPGVQTNIFDGTFNNGDITINLSYTDMGGDATQDLFDGWHLICNPYPSTLDWNSEGLIKKNIDNAVYVYQDMGDSEFNNYKYYIIGNNHPYSSITANGKGSCKLAPMQAAFVKTSIDALADNDLDGNPDGASITFTNDARVHSTQQFYKSGEEEIVPNLIRLQAERNGITDETVILFIEGADKNYDGRYDAMKRYSTSSKVPQVYSITPITKLAINTLPELTDGLVVPIGIVANQSGKYIFSATELNLEAGTTAYFIDKKENRRVNISDGKTYKVALEKGNYDKRFEIIFKLEKLLEEEITSDTEHILNENVLIYSFDKNIHIDMQNVKGIKNFIEIQDMLGKTIVKRNLEADRTEIPMSKFSSGNYIVKVITENKVYDRKVFVK